MKLEDYLKNKCSEMSESDYYFWVLKDMWNFLKKEHDKDIIAISGTIVRQQETIDRALAVLNCISWNMQTSKIVELKKILEGSGK